MRNQRVSCISVSLGMSGLGRPLGATRLLEAIPTRSPAAKSHPPVDATAVKGRGTQMTSTPEVGLKLDVIFFWRYVFLVSSRATNLPHLFLYYLLNCERMSTSDLQCLESGCTVYVFLLSLH